MPRIAQGFIEEIIAHHGELRSGPVAPAGVLRLALDLREARERIAALEAPTRSEVKRKPLPSPPASITSPSRPDGRYRKAESA